MNFRDTITTRDLSVNYIMETVCFRYLTGTIEVPEQTLGATNLISETTKVNQVSHNLGMTRARFSYTV